MLDLDHFSADRSIFSSAHRFKPDPSSQTKDNVAIIIQASLKLADDMMRTLDLPKFACNMAVRGQKC
jgi:hypothetical protein